MNHLWEVRADIFPVLTVLTARGVGWDGENRQGRRAVRARRQWLQPFLQPDLPSLRPHTQQPSCF